MAQNKGREEIEETYILGGVVGEGSTVYWKNIQFLEDVTMLEKFKKLRKQYGNGPFTILGVLKDFEENVFIRFKDEQGNIQEESENFFCSDKATSLSEGEALQLTI